MSVRSSLESQSLWLTLITLHFNSGVLSLNFNNHGYEDLLVTISPDIPVDSAEAIISKFHLYINLACLSVCLSVCLFVCLYPINVKTAEPIRPKFFVGHHMIPGKVYE